MNDYIFDPETMEGDYRESMQLWRHHFNCAPEAVDLSFKDSPIVPFVSYFEPTEAARSIETRMDHLSRLFKNNPRFDS